jgi:hypothetical protein
MAPPQVLQSALGAGTIAAAAQTGDSRQLDHLPESWVRVGDESRIA